MHAEPIFRFFLDGFICFCFCGGEGVVQEGVRKSFWLEDLGTTDEEIF